MDTRLLILQIIAVASAVLLFNLPIVSATSVEIVSGGSSVETVDLSPGNIVNRQVNIVRDPKDVTWSDIKVLVSINAATLAHSIRKIYIFKCQNDDPVECVRTKPIVFDTYVDTELAWKDISAKEGSSNYPQKANLLTLIKAEDANGKASWIGFWDIIRRTSYNVFDKFNYDPQGIRFHAKSGLESPAKSFMENFQMLPFNWAEKVEFTSSPLFAAGASMSEIEKPQFQTAKLNTNIVGTSGKDYYLIFEETSSGVANPAVINLNPSFNIGDGVCESDLGESSANSCYDCSCSDGYYCDSETPTSPGSCKQESQISIQASPYAPPITSCQESFKANVSVAITNAPLTLPETTTASITLNDVSKIVECTRTHEGYACPVDVIPEIGCGTGFYLVGPNTIDITLNYQDGPERTVKKFTDTFDDIQVNYNCGCESGYFCDIGEKQCSLRSSLSLSVIKVSSLINNFNSAGDYIEVTARVNNPPSDLNVENMVYSIGNITSGDDVIPGFTGTVNCEGGANTAHVYECLLPLNIDGYDPAKHYIVKGNNLNFAVRYSDGVESVTTSLSAGFSDVTIPSRSCGDGTCNVEESTENCCLDCGCGEDSSLYCDATRGCVQIGDVSLVIDSMETTEVEDCRLAHDIDVTTRVVNFPSGMRVNSADFISNDQISPWPFQCPEKFPGSGSGIYLCTITIPPLPNCELPYFEVGPNKISMDVSWQNGSGNIITQTLETDVDAIHLVPKFRSGDGICETEIGESASNSCVDCPCNSDPEFAGDDYYCDFDRAEDPSGTCKVLGDVTLDIKSPTQTVTRSSCERTQEVNIKATVENAPYNFNTVAEVAELNGTVVPIYCENDISLVSGPNASALNCTISIAPLSDCSKGKTYTFEDNKMQLMIEYQDGLGTRSSRRLLNATIPDIKITQKIQSLQDIINSAVAQYQSKLRTTLKIAKDMLNSLNMCVKLTIVWAVVGLVAAVAGGFTIAKKGAVGEYVKAASTAYQAGFTAIQKICDSIQAYNEALLKVQEIEFQLVRMEMCIDVSQHEIDVGGCEGSPDSCFRNMANCVDFGAVQQAAGDISKTTQRITTNVVGAANAIGDGIGAIADYIDYTKGAGGTLQVRTIGGGGASKLCTKSGYAVPRTVDATGSTISFGSCKQAQVQILYSDPKESCENPKIRVEENHSGTWTPLGNAFYSGDELKGDLTITLDDVIGNVVEGTEKDIRFQVYCDDDNDGIDADDIAEGENNKHEMKIEKGFPANAAAAACGCKGIQNPDYRTPQLSVTVSPADRKGFYRTLSDVKENGIKVQSVAEGGDSKEGYTYTWTIEKATRGEYTPIGSEIPKNPSDQEYTIKSIRSNGNYRITATVKSKANGLTARSSNAIKISVSDTSAEGFEIDQSTKTLFYDARGVVTANFKINAHISGDPEKQFLFEAGCAAEQASTHQTVTTQQLNSNQVGFTCQFNKDTDGEDSKVHASISTEGKVYKSNEFVVILKPKALPPLNLPEIVGPAELTSDGSTYYTFAISPSGGSRDYDYVWKVDGKVIPRAISREISVKSGDLDDAVGGTNSVQYRITVEVTDKEDPTIIGSKSKTVKINVPITSLTPQALPSTIDKKDFPFQLGLYVTIVDDNGFDDVTVTAKPKCSAGGCSPTQPKITLTHDGSGIFSGDWNIQSAQVIGKFDIIFTARDKTGIEKTKTLSGIEIVDTRIS